MKLFKGYSSFEIVKYIQITENKTPAMHRDIFRLRLANNRHLIENLPPPR